MDQVAYLVEREIGGSHDEASSGGVAVDLEAGGLGVELESPRHKIVVHENSLHRQFESGGGKMRWMIGVGGEEVDGGDVVVKHLIYVGEEQGSFVGLVQREN